MSRTETTISRHGHDFYQRAGRKGGLTTSKLYGKEYLKMISSKGGKNSKGVKKTK